MAQCLNPLRQGRHRYQIDILSASDRCVLGILRYFFQVGRSRCFQKREVIVRGFPEDVTRLQIRQWKRNRLKVAPFLQPVTLYFTQLPALKYFDSTILVRPLLDVRPSNACASLCHSCLVLLTQCLAPSSNFLSNIPKMNKQSKICDLTRFPPSSVHGCKPYRFRVTPY